MALWPNNNRMAGGWGPFRHHGGQALGSVAYKPLGGNRFNSMMALGITTSVPEGAAPHTAWTYPRKAGGMAAAPEMFSSTFTVSLLSGGAVAGTMTMEATPNGDLSLIVKLASAADVMTFTVPNASLVAVSGLVGTASVLLDTFNSSLSIINPMSGAFVSTFQVASDLKGLLSMFGNFNNTGVVDPSYDDAAVHVAPWGIDGTTYPSGTASQPVLTMAAAHTVASRYNLHEIHFTGEHTLTRDFSNFTFRGSGPTVFNGIDLNNQPLDRVRFIDCSLTGQVNATSVAGSGWQATKASVSFLTCNLFDIVDLEGNSDLCQLEGTTLIKAGGWFSATRLVIEGDFTFIDMRSTAGTTFSADIVSGWAQFQNLTTDGLVELNVKGGEISFDSSCDTGAYYFEGIGTFFNDGANMIKKENHFVWDEPRSYHTELESTGESLTDIDREVDELHKLAGLDITTPMVVTATSRTAGATIDLDIATGGGGDVTVTRQP